MENSVKHNADIYGKGNVLLTLFKLSLPIVVFSLGQAAYQLVDSLISANLIEYGNNYNASTALAAVTPIIIILFAISQLAALGFGIKLSRALAKNNEKDINEHISSGFIAFVVSSVLVILVTMTISKPIFDAVYAYIDDVAIRQEIINDASLYLYFSTIVMIFILFRNTISIVLRSEGHIKAVSYLPLLSIPINIVLDVVFMSPNMVDAGLAGAAYASMVAEAFAVILVLILVGVYKKRNSTHLGLAIAKTKVNWKIVGGILLLGLTPFIMQTIDGLLTELGVLLLSKTLPANYDPTINGDWVGWRGAMFSPLWLVLTSGVAIAQVGTTFISYNIGTKDRDRVNKGIIYSIVLFWVYTVIMAVIISLLGKQVLGLFKISLDHELSSQMLFWFVGWLFVSILVDMIYQYTDFLNAMNKPKTAIIFTLSNSLLIMLPLMIITFVIFKGTEHFYLFLLFYPLYAVIQTLVLGTIFTRIVFKNNKKMKEEWDPKEEIKK